VCRVVGCFVRLCNGGQFHRGLRGHSHRSVTMTRSGGSALSLLSVTKLWLYGRLGCGGSGGLCSLRKCWEGRVKHAIHSSSLGAMANLNHCSLYLENCGAFWARVCSVLAFFVLFIVVNIAFFVRGNTRTYRSPSAVANLFAHSGQGKLCFV
jgi:hypothetical protein